MKLTSDELLELATEYDLKSVKFEEKIRNHQVISYTELEEYITGSIIVLLSLIKLNEITIDEMLETCLNQVHK